MKKICLLMLCQAFAVAAGAESGITYPITQKMSNPLFVNLPSPMYKSDSIGHLYTADASAHVWGDGRLYLYASHDMEPAKGCDRMDRYHVFSTDDLQTWTDHGEILNSYDVMEQGGWGIEGWMWAPDCAYNPADSTYYFYFPHVNYAKPEGGHDWRIGVAASKHPAKDFKLIGYVEGAASFIDPCVFVDDDGQPYIYNGGGGTCMGGKLRRDDWTRLDGEMKRMEGLEDFHEATWIHKHDGKYYLSHSDNHYKADGNYMRYAVSDSPLGPWKPCGIYMYPTGCETNHGSIVWFKGKCYAAYHTANFSGHGTLRSVCIDEITMNPDGTLEMCHNWGEPHNGVMPVLGGETVVIEGEAYNDGGEHYAFHKWGTEPGRTGSALLGKGEWARYSFTAPKSGKCRVEIVTDSEKCAGPSRYHLSVCGDKQGQSVSGPESGVIEEVSFDGGEQYFDIRVEDGLLAVDKLIITPIN